MSINISPDCEVGVKQTKVGITCFLHKMILLVFLLNFSYAAAENSDIVINEIMYNPSASNTGGEFVEITNRGTESVDVSGWQLVDSSQIMFTLPAGTAIPRGGYLVFYDDAAALDFYGLNRSLSYGPYTGGLDGGGERIQLKNAVGMVIDEVIYDDNWPWPTEPDGNGPSLELWDSWLDNSQGASWGAGQSYSPGVANNPASSGSGNVVITEIMYAPVKQQYMETVCWLITPHYPANFYWQDDDDSAGEYIELYNRTAQSVDLSGWQMIDQDGLLYAFTGGSIAPYSYLAVCSDAAAVAAHYGISNAVGNFTTAGQRLSNSGERITLTNHLGAVIDSVRYKDEPPWPIGPDQDGVSLECLDPHSENDTPVNWRASRGNQFAANMVVMDVNTNNGSFEPNDSGWNKTGNHAGTDRTDTDYYDGTGCEKLVATAAGGSSSHSLNRTLIGMTTGLQYTLTCRLKYLSGHNTLTFRFSGGGLQTTVTGTGGWQYVETTGIINSSLLYFYINGAGEWLVDQIRITSTTQGNATTPIPNPLVVGDEIFNLGGTPGRANTVSSSGIPPFINVDKMKHIPQCPTSADSVLITTEVSSKDSITSVSLDYQVYIDPYQTPVQSHSVSMYDDGLHGDDLVGDGKYGIVLEALASQTLVRYRVTATDNHQHSWTYPDEYEPNPNRAYFVYDGEEDTNLPAYFLIMPKSSLDTLINNLWYRTYYDAALVVEGKVYDHVGVHYKGQGTRDFSKRSWKIAFNKGEYLRDLSSLDLTMHFPIMQKVIHDLFWTVGEENVATEMVRLYASGYWPPNVIQPEIGFGFYGVYLAQESPDRSWMKKHGYDEDQDEIFKPAAPGYWGPQPWSDLTYYSDFGLYPKMYEKKADRLGSFDSIIDLCDKIDNTSDAEIFNVMSANVDLNNWLYNWGVHMAVQDFDIHGNNFFLLKQAESSIWKNYSFDFSYAFSWPGFEYAYHPYYTYNGYYNRWNERCFPNAAYPQLNDRYLTILEDLLDHYLTIEQVHQKLDEAYTRAAADRLEELNLGYGGNAPYVREVNTLKNFYTSRYTWLKNWLASQSFTRPANAHPLITLNPPVQQNDGIAITWQYSDAEGDACTVDLYWTDFKWTFLTPIPDANDLSATAGSFLWHQDLPEDYANRNIYIQAVIRDNNSYLVGRATTDNPVLVLADCSDIIQYNLGLPGDFNEDCYVNIDDFVRWTEDWLTNYDPSGSGQGISGSWNFREGLSFAANPNGPWSYGASPHAAIPAAVDTAIFYPYNNSFIESGSGTPWWHYDSSHPFYNPAIVPCLYYNNTSGSVYGCPAGMAALHSGLTSGSEAIAVVRWTAPAAGMVQVSGTFYAGNAGRCDYYLIDNQTTVLASELDTYNQFSFNLNVNVSTGDTLDFCVGAGTDGGSADTTPLEVEIAATTCASLGEYLDSDINQDCIINLKDFWIFAQQYLHCNNPQDPDCSLMGP